MPSIKSKTAISVFDIFASSASGRIIFLKLIDHIFGFLIILFIRGLLLFDAKREDAVPPKITNVLIIRPGGIGDAVWVLPMIRILKLRTGCSIDVLCERRNKAVFDLCREHIRDVLMYDSRGVAIVKRLAAQKYDCVIDTEQYHNFSAIFAFLASSRCRVGFDTAPFRSKIYTHKVAYSHQAQEYSVFSDLLAVLMPVSHQEYRQQMGVELSGTGAKLPQELAGKRYIAVFIGASVKERCWGSEKFAQLCAEIVKMGYRVVLLGGKEDVKRADGIRTLYGSRDMIDLVGKITLLQSVAVLKNGILAVGADSGIMHLACVLDCPAVWLFGAGIEEKWFPQWGRNESVNLHLPCSPCTVFGYTPRCPYEVRCLKDISVGQVADKIRTLLGKSFH